MGKRGNDDNKIIRFPTKITDLQPQIAVTEHILTLRTNLQTLLSLQDVHPEIISTCDTIKAELDRLLTFQIKYTESLKRGR